MRPSVTFVAGAFLAASGLLLVPGSARPTASLLAAVLPSSRSVQVGTAATAFATIINAGTATATGCRPRLVSNLPGRFTFQATDASTNAPVNTPDSAVDIPPGSVQSFVIGFVPAEPIAPVQARFAFECENAGPAPSIDGLNTLLVSAAVEPVPDIVAVPATLNADGIANILGATEVGVFAVAAVNLGAPDTVTAVADTGTTSLPVTVALCRTDRMTGACLSPTAPAPSVTSHVAADETLTFAVFVTARGPIPFDPAASRIFVRFEDSSGATRGSASVAARTLSPGDRTTHRQRRCRDRARRCPNAGAER